MENYLNTLSEFCLVTRSAKDVCRRPKKSNEECQGRLWTSLALLTPAAAHICQQENKGGVPLWGDWGAADSSVVKSGKRGRDNDLI